MPIHPDQALVKGDIITVQAWVELGGDGGEHVYARVGGEYGAPISVKRESADLVSTVIKVGDEVQAVEAVDGAPSSIWPFGIVVAVVGPQAWIEWPVGPGIEPVATLRRARTAHQVAENEPRPGERAVPVAMAAE